MVKVDQNIEISLDLEVKVDHFKMVDLVFVV